MRSEKQKDRPTRIKSFGRNQFKNLTFDEKVKCKDFWNRPFDPDVARAYGFLSRQKQKREKAKNKAVAAIMQMRGI